VKDMKKLVTLLIVTVLAVSLSACATTQGGAAKIKCPSCGYEFDAPVEG
jgi:predicted small secreted protein